MEEPVNSNPVCRDRITERTGWLYSQIASASDSVSEKASRLLVVLAAMGAAIAYLINPLLSEDVQPHWQRAAMGIGAFSGLALLWAFWIAAAMLLPRSIDVPGYTSLKFAAKKPTIPECDLDGILQGFAASNLAAIDGYLETVEPKLRRLLKQAKWSLRAVMIGVILAAACRAGPTVESTLMSSKDSQGGSQQDSGKGAGQQGTNTHDQPIKITKDGGSQQQDSERR